MIPHWRKEQMIHQFTDRVPNENMYFLNPRGDRRGRDAEQVIDLSAHLTSGTAGEANSTDAEFPADVKSA